MHPNAPSRDDTEWVKTVRRVKWLFVGIVAPEYISYLAIREWYEVRWALKKICDIVALPRSKHTDKQKEKLIPIDAEIPAFSSLPDVGSIHGDARTRLHQEAISSELLEEPDQSQTTRSSAELTVMEDIDEESQQVAIGHGATPDSSVDDNTQTSIGSVVELTAEYGHYLYMGGFELLFSGIPPFRLNCLQFLYLLKNRQIDLPDVSAKTIRSYSKSDIFTKPWACLQMIWFITVLIARWISHLPITTLELFTAAQIFCTLATYVAWWKKPKDLEVLTGVQFKGTLVDMQVVMEIDMFAKVPNASRVRNIDTIARRETGMQHFTLVGYLPTIAFGFGHLLGWYHYFVTPVERILWQTSSVCCLVLPLALAALSNITGRGYANPLRPGLWIMTYLYIIFRLYIYAEMFAGLRQLPAAVYEDNNFTRYIPHFGG
jgi:hypothetical protein